MAPTILRDIIYTEALVDRASGTPRKVPLRLDAYLPEGRGPHPVLVLAFGGAFHRGSKSDDAFPGVGDAGDNTAMAEYCRRFAAQGFACFSIDYRLAPSDPEPTGPSIIAQPEQVPMGRIAQVREIMGLPPASAADMARVMEAGIEDFTAAVAFLRTEHARFNIDTSRFVLGGWSAGARCALYAAYGRRVTCRGVIALSGVLQPDDTERFLATPKGLPPLLLIAAERDLGYVQEGAITTVAAFTAAGVPAHLVRVPGYDHWYPAEAPTDAGATVQGMMQAALDTFSG
jgi:acetyl esterase/lipase